MGDEQGQRRHGDQRPVVVAPGGGSPGRSLAVLAALGVLVAGAVALAMRGAPSIEPSPPAAERAPAEAAPAPAEPVAGAVPAAAEPVTGRGDRAPTAAPAAAPKPFEPEPVADPQALRRRMQALLPAGMQVESVRVSGEVVFATGRAPRNAVVSDGLRVLDAAAQAYAPDAPRVELLSVRMDANGVAYEVRVPVAALTVP